ncbi:MAG TPA: hypothetical protein ENI49_01525 [Thermoplasmatales archaeon]|nr:hypothetical protein [Thermoplasmatales archaeon]
MKKKRIMIGSILIISAILLASIFYAFGSTTAKSTKKITPLFKIRSGGSIKENIKTRWISSERITLIQSLLWLIKGEHKRILNGANYLRMGCKDTSLCGSTSRTICPL